MPDPSEERYVLINRLAEEFAARCRRGEQPSIQEYCDQHPELADDIRLFFPAMVRREQATEATPEITGKIPASPPAPALEQLGDFRILREIGHGGMGVVYEAEQVSLGRRVALKLLTQRLLRDANQRRRFEREARSAARLHHTNIVPVHGYGEHDGCPYYVMQFIQGTSLDAVIDEVARLDVPATAPSPIEQRTAAVAAARSLITGEGQPGTEASGEDYSATGTFAAPVGTNAETEQLGTTPSPSSAVHTDLSGVTSSVTLLGHSGVGPGRKPRKLSYWQAVARLGVQVADALEYAHRQGIIHRDVKPSNLLLDAGGTVWVTDFGLAKADGSDNLTHTGDVLGTLRYMPPEAFEGKAEARSDIYALGLTLYEMLALRPAYNERDRNKLIKQVTTEAPPRLGKVRPAVPRDLETIIDKAIDRDPIRRYQTAGELAADLHRFIEDEPIKARRQTAVEAAWRWTRHHKAMAALLATVVLVLVGITIGSLSLAAYFRQQEAVQRGLVNDKTVLAERNQKLADDNEQARATVETALRKSETTLVDMQTSRGLLAAERGDAALATLWFAKAAEHATSDPQRQADNRLRARNWARDLVRPIGAFSAGSTPTQLAFRPGGDYLLVRSQSGFTVWDCRQGEPLPWPDGKAAVTAACWNHDGSILALAQPTGAVQLRSMPDRTLLRELPARGAVTSLAFGPDGRHLIVAGSFVRIWDTQSNTFLKGNWPHPAAVEAVAFNGKGDRFVTACGDKKARVFAVAEPERPVPLFAPVAHEPEKESAPAFVDGDRGLVAVTKPGEVHWYDAETGEPAGFGTIPSGASMLGGVTASVGGGWFAVWGIDSAEVWNASTPNAKPILLKHSNQVRDLVFGRDGVTVLTASLDQTARLWSLPDGQPIGAPLPHMYDCTHCALSSDASVIATSGWDGQIRLWKRPVRQQEVPYAIAGTRVRPSPNGQLLAPGQWYEIPRLTRNLGTSQLVVLDSATGRPAGPAVSLRGLLVDSCMCSDNRTAAAGVATGTAGELVVCNVLTGKQAFAPRKLPSLPMSVAASPNSSQVAVLCESGELLVFDSRSGERAFDLRHDDWVATQNRWARAEYTPDGATLITLTNGSDNSLHIRDAATGQLRYPPIRPVIRNGPCRSFAVSADSSLLATAVNGTNAVQVWDMATGRPLCQPIPHPGDFYGLFHLAFSPNGRLLITGSKDRQARVWDWSARKLVCPPLEHPDEVFAVAFTPDGRYALTGGRAPGGFYAWEVTTGKLVAPPVVPPGDSVVSLWQSPDGTHVVAALILGSAIRIDLNSLLTPPTHATADFTLLAELATSQRIELGDVSALTPEQWQERWQRYRAKAEDYTRPTLAEARVQAATHRAAAQQLAETGQPVEALVQWRRGMLEIERAGGSESDRQAVRVTILKEACAILERQFSQKPDDATASVLADLLLESRDPTPWTVLQPNDVKSTAGTTFTRLPDRSLLAGGPIPDRDTYTVEAHNPLPGATVIRLETLPDPSLPRSGPGRHYTGNFALTEFSVSAASGASITLLRATGYLPPADSNATPRDGPHGAIDGTHSTRWDVWPRFGQASSLFVEPAEPIAPGLLSFRLDCLHPVSRQFVLGRFRLSATTRPNIIRDENLIAMSGGKDGRVRLATARIIRGEWREALDALQQLSPQARGTHEFLLLALVHEQLGQPAEADKFLDEAMPRLPLLQSNRLLLELGITLLSQRIARDPKPALLLTRSRWHGILGRQGEAGADLGRALETDPKITLRPEHAYPLAGLGDAAAEKGDWAKAAEYYSRAVELFPANLNYWQGHLHLYLRRGDQKGYQKGCAELVKRFEKTTFYTTANSAAWLCVVSPDSGVDPAIPLKLAELAASKDPGFLTLNTLGAALYRAGKYEQAIEKLKASMAASGSGGVAWDWLFLAMAHHQLDNKDEATMWLAKASEFVAEMRKGKVSASGSGGLQFDWKQKLELELVLTEARMLIEAKKP